MESSMARPRSEPGDYRYERKFRVAELTRQEIEAMLRLHPALFVEPFPPRWVNNVYFDGLDYQNYRDNMDGIEQRVKARVRWYGPLLGCKPRPVLELKIKNGLVGRKEHFPLPEFGIGPSHRLDGLHDALRRAEIPPTLKLQLSCMEPALLNRYWRKYFLSADRRYRITIDSDMEYYRIEPGSRRFLHRSLDRTTMILELKYDPAWDRDAQRITNRFPFRLTKNSKYATGIERVLA